MSPDQQYLQDLQDAHAIAQSASDVRQFEFLCSFNNQLLCLLEAELRKTSVSAGLRNTIPTLRAVAALGLRVLQPFVFPAGDTTNVIGWADGIAASFDGIALDLVQSALRMAHREVRQPSQPWETRRWAFGMDEEQLELNAKLKRELALFSVRQAYSVMLVWVKLVLREGAHRAPEAESGALLAIDGTLGIINRVASWKPTGPRPHMELLDVLAPFAHSLDTSALGTGHPELAGYFSHELALRATTNGEDQANA